MERKEINLNNKKIMKKQFNFDYNGNNISFELGDYGIMVNATEMAKIFGCSCRPAFWLRYKDSQTCLQYISGVHQMNSTKLIDSHKGNYSNGKPQGTWIHEWVSLEYSKWLGGDIYFWLVGRLKEMWIITSNPTILCCDREEIVDFSLDLIDIVGEERLLREFEVLGGCDKTNPSIKNELGDLVFYFSTPSEKIVRMKKEDILMSVVEVGNNRFTLKVIDYLDNFIDSASHTYLRCKYYVLGNILGNISSSKCITGNQKTYLMKDSNTGYTKIGKAVDPKFRERTLQSEKPTISLFAVSDSLVEDELHRKYESKRIRGEWFKLEEKDVEEILRSYKFNVA